MLVDLERFRFERKYEQALADLEQFVIDEALAGRPVVMIIEKATLWEKIKRWFGRG